MLSSSSKGKLLGSQSSAFNIGFALFVGAILLANAILTIGFGMRFGAEIVNTGYPTLSKALGGFMLCLFFDLAAIGWFVARRREGLTTNQIATAKILSVTSITASVLVSVIQLAMGTTLVDLSGLHDGIGIMGLVLLAMVAAGHFVGLFYYQFTSKENLDAEIKSEQDARINDMRTEMKQKVQNAVIEKTEAKVYAEVDKIAEQEKDKILREFYADFNYLENGGSGAATAPPPPPPPEPKMITTEELKEIVAEAVVKKLDERQTPPTSDAGAQKIEDAILDHPDDYENLDELPQLVKHVDRLFPNDPDLRKHINTHYQLWAECLGRAHSLKPELSRKLFDIQRLIKQELKTEQERKAAA